MLLRKSNASLFTHLPPPPAGHVWVEWVGEPSPLDNPEIQLGLLENRFTPDQVAVIRDLCRRRIARVHNHSRTIRKGNGPGQIATLSRDWTFGDDQRKRPGHPKSYCKALPFRDADAIKSSSIGHEFIIHNERDGEAADLVLGGTGAYEVSSRIKIVPAGQFSSFGEFRRAMGWNGR